MNPIKSKYRPLLDFGFGKVSDGIFNLLEKDSLAPGADAEVLIRPMRPENLEGIKPGQNFEIREGSKKVGTGTYLELIEIEFQPGDLVEFNSQLASVLDIITVFSVNKARLQILSTGEIIEAKLETLKEALNLYSESRISYLVTAAKINSEVLNLSILSPSECSIVPLPHQILALEKVMSGTYIRFLLADEVGMGKTIEAGLVLKELKLRGLIKRTLIITTLSAMGQWQDELIRHFNEKFHIYDSESIKAFSRLYSTVEADNEFNLWTQHNQIIVSMDSLKPFESRSGWSRQRLEEYNKNRIQSALAAEFDLIVIDECHKVGGSSPAVGRFRMADILCNAIPNVLLLSATPHRGKSDHFRRILQLLDADAFAGEGMPLLNELEPYVIRTEKRQAINYDGAKLFNNRDTQKVKVYYDDHKHTRQQQLYDLVTDYVKTGYNQSERSKNNSYGFVMLLFQRLMSSSTQAIHDALEKRIRKLKDNNVGDTVAVDERDIDQIKWEGQLLRDYENKTDSVIQQSQQVNDDELIELEQLLNLSNDCLTNESDAKADYLIEEFKRIKKEEQNPDVKFLIFTEFLSTQAMLQEILSVRGGYNCEIINGGMSLAERVQVIKRFAKEVQVLVCTDSAGESLNMQFAHIVVNYDMPWNPMIVEQRIGRVDRIGQTKKVTAMNLMLNNSIDERVYDVIEEKLNRILSDIGIDKTADVLDSTIEHKSIEKLYLTSLLDPERFEAESDNWLDQIRNKLKDYQSTEGALPVVSSDEITKEKVNPIIYSPLPVWLQSMTKNYLTSKGIAYNQIINGIRFTFPGFPANDYTFNIKDSLDNPALEPLSLQHDIVRKIMEEAVPFTESQPIPLIKINAKMAKPDGWWSLWSLHVKNQLDSSYVYTPIFLSMDGNIMPTTANDLWSLFIQEIPEFSCIGSLSVEESKREFNRIWREAERHLNAKYLELEKKVSNNTERIKGNKEKAFAFQEKQLQKIGIENIKKSRLDKLAKEKSLWFDNFESSSAIIPDFSCLFLVKITNG